MITAYNQAKKKKTSTDKQTQDGCPNLVYMLKYTRGKLSLRSNKTHSFNKDNYFSKSITYLKVIVLLNQTNSFVESMFQLEIF